MYDNVFIFNNIFNNVFIVNFKDFSQKVVIYTLSNDPNAC